MKQFEEKKKKIKLNIGEMSQFLENIVRHKIMKASFVLNIRHLHRYINTTVGDIMRNHQKIHFVFAV